MATADDAKNISAVLGALMTAKQAWDMFHPAPPTPPIPQHVIIDKGDYPEARTTTNAYVMDKNKKDARKKAYGIGLDWLTLNENV